MGTLLVASITLVAAVAVAFQSPFIIRINGEAWYVTGNQAVQEWGYSFYLFGGSGSSRTILYPGLSYERYLEINITSIVGTIDVAVEYAGETLYETNNVGVVVVTIPVNSSQVSITVSPYWNNNMTLQGYVKAYCLIPSDSIPMYYLRSLFGGGD